MDKTGLLNKGPRVAAEDPPAVAETCPHCGLPMAPQRCRETPRGFYCQALGLIFDPAHTITSVQPDHIKPLVDADPDVVAVAAELETVESLFARRDKEWREICIAGINARNTFNQSSRVVYADDGPRMVYPKGSGLGDQSRLEQQQQEAAVIRDEAHTLVVRCRERLEAARRRSRARLTQPAA